MHVNIARLVRYEFQKAHHVFFEFLVDSILIKQVITFQ